MAVASLALRFLGFKFQGGSPKAAQTLCSPQNRSVPLEPTVGSAAPVAINRHYSFGFDQILLETIGFRRDRPWQGAGDVAPNPRT